MKQQKNRYLDAEKANFEEMSNDENSVVFAGSILGIAMAGYLLTLQVMESYKLPDSLPFFVALLAPVLFVAGISSWAKIKTVKDIEEEVQEAIEKTAEAQQQALLSIEKANDYDRLKADYDRLQKLNDRSKQDNDRLWLDYRALEDKLTTAKTSATTVLSEAQKGIEELKQAHALQLKQAQNAYSQLQNRLLAIETAISIEGEVGSLNGRSAKATGDEKEAIERQKEEQRARMLKHLQENKFLLTLKTSWAGIRI